MELGTDFVEIKLGEGFVLQEILEMVRAGRCGGDSTPRYFDFLQLCSLGVPLDSKCSIDG
jgi:hypothetical protein